MKKNFRNEEYDYDFLDYDYWKIYNVDPLFYCLINEQFECIRSSFRDLNDDTKKILDYFVIKNYDSNNYDDILAEHLNLLKGNYLKKYEKKDKLF